MKIKSFLLLFIFAWVLPMAAGEPQETIHKDSVTVYICTGPKATKYHSRSNCRGLNRCSGEVVAIPMDKAQRKGYSPCRICYR